MTVQPYTVIQYQCFHLALQCNMLLLPEENNIIDKQLNVQLIDFGLECLPNDYMEPQQGRVDTPIYMPRGMLESK